MKHACLIHLFGGMLAMCVSLAFSSDFSSKQNPSLKICSVRFDWLAWCREAAGQGHGAVMEYVEMNPSVFDILDLQAAEFTIQHHSEQVCVRLYQPMKMDKISLFKLCLSAFLIPFILCLAGAIQCCSPDFDQSSWRVTCVHGCDGSKHVEVYCG